MSPQPNLFSLLVWLAVSHLIASDVVLWDQKTGPKITDVGNCIQIDSLTNNQALNNCGFAAVAAGLAYTYTKNPSYLDNLIHKVDDDTAIVRLIDHVGSCDNCGDSGTKYPVISITVPINNIVPSSASQSPLAATSTIVWPTVLQNAVILLRQQAPGKELTNAGGFYGDADVEEVLLTPDQALGQNKSQNWESTQNLGMFSQWWQWASYVPCTSVSKQASLDGSVILNHDYVAVDCVPSPCDFSTTPKPSVKLYDPTFTGKPQQVNLLPEGPQWQDEQGYITLTFKQWTDIFGGIWCALDCPDYAPGNECSVGTN